MAAGLCRLHTGKWSQALGEKGLWLPQGEQGAQVEPYLRATQAHPSGAERSPGGLGWVEETLWRQDPHNETVPRASAAEVMGV